MERRTNHGHTSMVRLELIPKDNEASNRTIKKVPALRMALVECTHKGDKPQGDESYQADCLEALITLCAGNGMAEETVRKITNYWTKSIRDLPVNV